MARNDILVEERLNYGCKNYNNGISANENMLHFDYRLSILEMFLQNKTNHSTRIKVKAISLMKMTASYAKDRLSLSLYWNNVIENCFCMRSPFPTELEIGKLLLLSNWLMFSITRETEVHEMRNMCALRRISLKKLTSPINIKTWGLY